MAQLKISAAQMVAAARARISEVEAVDLIARLADADQAAGLVVVDLRDRREREREGFIPGSFHCPRGMLEFWVDPDSPYFKPVFAQDKTFVLHCASGWRSALAAATLLDMGFPVAHLREGFSTWAAQGGPVDRYPDQKPDRGLG